MIKIPQNTNLGLKQVQEIIRKMPAADKVKLIRELQKETWAEQLDLILANIDRRRRKHKIPSKTISQEIEKARKEFHARRSR